MLGRLLATLYASPTAPTPSAATSRLLRRKPVTRLTRLATAIVRLFASRLRVPASSATVGVSGSAGCAGVVPGPVSGNPSGSSTAAVAVDFAAGRRERRRPTYVGRLHRSSSSSATSA